MDRFPQFNIEGEEIDKLLIGINSVLGFSHTSRGRDEWIRRYFTNDRIAEVFSAAIERGVSSILGPIFPKLHDAIHRTEQLTNKKMTFVPTTFGPKEGFSRQIQELKALGAKFCCLHGGWTDTWTVEQGKLPGLEDWIKQIRDVGLIPGAASHNVEMLRIMMEQDYDFAFFVTPINKGGFYMHPSREAALHVVSQASKPVIAIKPLASGRFDEDRIEDWLSWTLNTQGVSAICVGFMSPEEAAEDIDIAKRILQTERKPMQRPQSGI